MFVYFSTVSVQECKLTPILSLFFVFYRYLTYFNGVEKYSFHLCNVELRCFRFFNFWIVKSTTRWCFRLDKCNRRKLIKIKCNSLIFRVCWYISWFLGLDVSFYHAIGNPISLGMIGFLLGTYISLQTNVCFPQKRTIDTFSADIYVFQFWNS